MAWTHPLASTAMMFAPYTRRLSLSTIRFGRGRLRRTQIAFFSQNTDLVLKHFLDAVLCYEHLSHPDLEFLSGVGAGASLDSRELKGLKGDGLHSLLHAVDG